MARRPRGFTLLELSLAMAVAGLLVALLVAAWVQANREGLRRTAEAEAFRRREALRTRLLGVAQDALWTSASHLPQGALPWRSQAGAITFWSRQAGGRPGPGRWQWSVQGNAMEAQVEDVGGGGAAAERWEGVTDLRIWVAQRQVALEGEGLAWIGLDQWDPGLPFRPLGLRLQWRRSDGAWEEVEVGW